MGWIANALIILYMWLVGSKNRWAFVAGSVGNLIWMFIGIKHEMYDLAFLSVVLTVLNIRAWLKWRF